MCLRVCVCASPAFDDVLTLLPRTGLHCITRAKPGVPANATWATDELPASLEVEQPYGHQVVPCNGHGRVSHARPWAVHAARPGIIAVLRAQRCNTRMADVTRRVGGRLLGGASSREAAYF